jgi:hypothetical protein
MRFYVTPGANHGGAGISETRLSRS